MNSSPPKRSDRVGVAIVDDDPAVLLSHRLLIEATDDCYCAGAFPSGAAFLASLSASPAQVVLMDIRMPGMSGLECTHLTKERRLDLKVIVVTGLAENHAVTAALEEGADYFLVKPVTLEQLRAAIRFVLDRDERVPRTPLARPGIGGAAETFCPVPDPPFTKREQELLRLLSAGRLYKEIADSLATSEAVVRKLVHGVYERLGVHTRADAMNRLRDLASR